MRGLVTTASPRYYGNPIRWVVAVHNHLDLGRELGYAGNWEAATGVGATSWARSGRLYHSKKKHWARYLANKLRDAKEKGGGIFEMSRFLCT